jgi:GMP synthase PP-ATPase subunit
LPARLGSAQIACPRSKTKFASAPAIATFSSSSAAASIPRSPARSASAPLGAERVQGVYVDTGLMREGETDRPMRRMPGLSVESAEAQFLGALAGVRDPEQKRHIIGEEFVRVQERILESRHLLDGRWILGQGTIYPDTIESGGTEKAAVIKTHHNRVPGIQRLIDEGRIVEPLRSFYKDEVREIGRSSGSRRDPRPPSVSRPGSGHPLPLFGHRSRRPGHRGRLHPAGPLRRRAGR